MDERIPVGQALGIELGDARIYRNAGGKVTDDITRNLRVLGSSQNAVAF